MKNITATFFLIILSCTARAQSDSTLTIIAFWEINDSITWEVTTREEVMEDGMKEVEKTTYDAILTILDSTETSYKIRWETKNLKFHYDMDPLIKKLLSSLPELPLIYQTDEYGKLQDLKNWKYMKSEMGKAMDRLRNDFPELPDSTARRIKASIMSKFESEEQIMFQMKDLRSFHYLYGEVLPLEEPLVRTTYFTNSYLQEFLPGEETINIVSIDEEMQIAHIRSVSELSKERNLELVSDFLKKKHAILKTEPPSINDIPDFGTTLVKDFHIDLSTGYVLTGSFVKKVEFENGYFLDEVIFSVKK
jgi:hypothetical protein